MGSTAFDEFCEALNKPLWSKPVGHEAQAYGHSDRLVAAGSLRFDMTILNYANYIKKVLSMVHPAIHMLIQP